MEKLSVNVDVGGERFVLNEPSDTLKVGGGGLLGSIIYDNGKISWERADGTIFFDRDPTFFQYILNYFHDASLPEGCLSPANMENIRREAEYYSLEGLSVIMSCRIENHYTEPFNVRGEVSKNLAIYFINLQQELRNIRNLIEPHRRSGGRRGIYRLAHTIYPNNVKTRTAIIERVLHLVKCTLPKRKDPFHVFVNDGGLQAKSNCLFRLDALIGYCTELLRMKLWEARRGTTSTARLINKLADNNRTIGSDTRAGWNTWQRHPLSNIVYKTPEFALKHIKDEEAERRRECGCYLCTFVPRYPIPYETYDDYGTPYDAYD